MKLELGIKLLKGLFLSLIFGLGPSLGKAQTPPIAKPVESMDRRALFEKAYELLPSVLAVAIDMGIVNNDFRGAEFSTFDKIREVVLSDFKAGRKDRLQFSEDQELFKLDANQPVRTAVTSGDPRDPIFINLKVINDATNSFELEDALQILIHEYGHKTPDKIQSVVDSVAAKIRAFIVTHITHAMSDSGNKVTAVAFPTMTGGGELARMVAGQKQKSIFTLTSALLFQNNQKVADFSAEWDFFLRSHAGFRTLKPGIIENTELRIWEIGFQKVVNDQGSSTEVFSIEFMKSDVASPTGQPGVRTTTSGQDGSEYSNIARGNAPDLRAEIAIDSQAAKVKSIFIKGLLVPQPQLKARIAHLKRTDHDSFEIGIKIATPFDFRKVKLLLETEDREFSVLAKTIWPGHDRILFDVKLPRAQAEKKFSVRAFVADNRSMVLLDEGIALQALATKVAEGPLRLESLSFGDGERSQAPGASQPLEPKNTRMTLTLESPQDIQEIRFERRRDLSVFDPVAYTTKDDPKIYDIENLESIRSDYSVRELDRSEFTQVRNGKFVTVTVPLSDEIFHFDAGEFYPNSRAPKNSVVARDDGERAITSLEIIDTSLRSLRIGEPGKPFSFQLITPGKPASRDRTINGALNRKSFSEAVCRRALSIH
jgi:hypothetical protein